MARNGWSERLLCDTASPDQLEHTSPALTRVLSSVLMVECTRLGAPNDTLLDHSPCPEILAAVIKDPKVFSLRISTHTMMSRFKVCS